MIISEVKQFLQKHGPATLGVITVNLKCDREVASAAIDHMVMQGRVEVLEPGDGCSCSGCPGSCPSKGTEKLYALK
jgi:hypothetical protein